jgi:hypothetical protein
LARFRIALELSFDSTDSTFFAFLTGAAAAAAAAAFLDVAEDTAAAALGSASDDEVLFFFFFLLDDFFLAGSIYLEMYEKKFVGNEICTSNEHEHLIRFELLTSVFGRNNYVQGHTNDC